MRLRTVLAGEEVFVYHGHRELVLTVAWSPDGRLIGSREKYLVMFHRSYHVIMKDHDREEVFAKTAAFISRNASKAKPHRAVVPGEQMA